jgi:hypothetical protein
MLLYVCPAKASDGKKLPIMVYTNHLLEENVVDVRV